MTVATVLVPTHEHGRLLRYAVESALAQTVQDVEVLIVCDGANEETLEVARDLEFRHDRVRAFENPKGERHGEEHRHRALGKASGRIVCYLSDDDLWLPDHVERLLAALENGADFAFTRPVYIENGHSIPIVLPLSWGVALRSGRNFIPLSVAAHTLAVYRRLPEGWSPAPADLFTDLHMWLKFWGADATFVGVPEITACIFPAGFRADWTLQARAEELEVWWTLVRSNLERVRIALADGSPVAP